MAVFGDKQFDGLVERVVCFCSSDVRAAVARVEELARSYHVVGYMRYELKDVFLGKDFVSDLPLVFFEAFKSCSDYVPSYSTDELLLDVRPMWSYGRYAEAFEAVKEDLVEGNTYEVNLTQPFEIHASMGDAALFDTLRHRQPTPYAAFIENEYESVLSFSPELFFSLRDGVIKTKPMKGTIRRDACPVEDARLVEFLRSDEKNRAENVMIVDLLRNDLSRIACTGSVKVARLFEVESHPSLHQMTSEVSAELLEGLSLYDVLQAVFPCGSITGAPKISTMEIIERLEAEPRGIYCGAIAYLNPDEMVFSVPIRILQRRADELAYLYRVGGAVVWDSKVHDEWQECYTKLAFLKAQSGLQLLETMAVRDGKIVYADLHWARMRASADTLGFAFPDALCGYTPTQDGMLRVLLSRDGYVEFDYRPLVEIDVNSPLRVALSPQFVESANAFLYHKTSWRPWYADSAARCAEQGLFDELFVNERGELTEGARTNIIVQLDGQWFTPPLSCGLLNGVLRQHLLDEARCTERVLYPADLFHAEKIFCINSVRGICEVSLA